MEAFSQWLQRLSCDTVVNQVVKGDREVADLVVLVRAWIRDVYPVDPDVAELQVRTAIEESVQALQEDGELLYQPDIDALVERSLYWRPNRGVR